MGKEDRIEPWVEDVFVLLWIELAPGRSHNSSGDDWLTRSVVIQVETSDREDYSIVPGVRANSLHTTFHGPSIY